MYEICVLHIINHAVQKGIGVSCRVKKKTTLKHHSQQKKVNTLFMSVNK